ncbi:hypothetical protein CHUAL_000524 [Chamberlinius hualienensis]
MVLHFVETYCNQSGVEGTFLRMQQSDEPLLIQVSKRINLSILVDVMCFGSIIRHHLRSRSFGRSHNLCP